MKVPMRSPFPFLSGRISISSLSSAALFACAILLGVGARRAWADAAPAAGEQVPRVFTYRGQLTLDSGSSAGASKLLRFSLYRTANGGTSEFTENKVVALGASDGAFATDIGECLNASCTGNLQATLDAATPSLYIGIAVCTGSNSTANDCSSWTELAGRQRLLSSFGAANTSGQIVGYWRSSGANGCISGTAGGWVASGSSLHVAPPVRSRLVVHYIANVQGTGSVSASIDLASPFGYISVAPESLATAKPAITYEGAAMKAGNVIEHTFVLTGQTDPTDLVLRSTTSSGVPRLCDGGSSYIEVTAYAE